MYAFQSLSKKGKKNMMVNYRFAFQYLYPHMKIKVIE